MANNPLRRIPSVNELLESPQLRKLVDVYYRQRGWNANGVPTVATLQGLGLWDLLNSEARERITALNA